MRPGFLNLQIDVGSMMHAPVYTAICSTALAGTLLFGTPELGSLALAAAVAIAVLGVPHGGLDHWTGRRLLHQRFASRWWIVFFPAYLSVGLLFAWGWFTAPTFTVVLFFIISAWHFGREDHAATRETHAVSRLTPPPSGSTVGNDSTASVVEGALNLKKNNATNRAYTHVLAAATGGLVIWLPALARPSELASLLGMIVPTTADPDIVNSIVSITQVIAGCLVPLALSHSLLRLFAAPGDRLSWVPLATAALAIGTPILLSFSIYFCGWHSWQGLQRLRREERLSSAQFIRSVTPLSLAAVSGVALAGISMTTSNLTTSTVLGSNVSDTLPTLFIGLSAIAVPHLLLHEWVSLRAVASLSQPALGQTALIQPSLSQQVSG